MTSLKEQYIGKQLTWEEAVNLFPDLWVAFKDCTYNKVTFVKGILVDVIEDKDRIEYMNKHWDEGLHIDRTTEASGGEYIHGILIEKEPRHKVI